jgi:hypothetical protein
MENERIPEKFLMRKFHKISRRSKKAMGGLCPKGCIADRKKRRYEGEELGIEKNGGTF